MTMQKILVIGCPGGGKSYFARALHAQTDIPLVHLDMLYWNADKTTVEKSVFLERLSTALARDAWIIDGNYASTLKERLSACDTVFFLDYPTEICLEGVRARRRQARPDLPWVEDGEDADFIDFIKHFSERQRPQMLELLAQYPDKTVITFTDRVQADAFLRENETKSDPR